MKTVAAVFSTMIDVERAVRELERVGVPDEAISIIAGDEEGRHKEYLEASHLASRSAGVAAASGASFGGGVGIIASLVALAVPGVGAIVAGGALATVIAGFGVGAAGGGVISALHSMAIPHEKAPLYDEAVRRGALMVVVETTDPMEKEVVNLMAENGGRDLEDAVDTWNANGWSGPKSDPHPYVSDSRVTWHDPPKE
jgi:hypothetical protein